MVLFNQVPSNLRVPFVTAEFDASRAQQGPALQSYRALLVGQKCGDGSALANSLHKVTSADEVVSLAGRGSQLHRMALAWFDANKFTECWIGVLSDSSSSVLASGSLAFSGTASASGVIYLYLGGERVTVAVASGDSASTIASAVASAVGKHASGTVTFSSADAADNVTISGTLDGIAVSTTFVGTTGAVVAGAATYSVDTGNNETATSFASQVNAHATASRLVRASASSAIVTLRAVAGGVDGNSVALATTDAVDAAISGSNLSGGAAGDNEDLSVHATVSSGTVTLWAKNAGAAANEYDVRVNYNDGEALPDGVALSITDMASGATNPTLTTLVAALGDSQFHILVHPYTDATSLTAIENELSDRFGPERMIDGVAFTAKDDSYANCSTLGDSRNSQHSCILRTNDSPTPPLEYAAHVAAVVAKAGAADPARPFQTLALDYVRPPAEADRDTLAERNLLLYDGISTTNVGPGEQVQIERLITTYKENAAGSPDTAYLDVNTMLTLMYLRYSFRAWIGGKFPRHKLANDGTRVGSGQAVVTPKTMKGECIAWFRAMEERGLVENFDQFKTDLVVARNVSDPNRLDILLPPDLINQLVVTAANIQFRL